MVDLIGCESISMAASRSYCKMVEGGRRSHSKRERDGAGDSRVQKRRGGERTERGNDELIVYRILCPDGFIGSVIGKSGKVINSIRQETRAKIKVVDPFPGAKDRVILIYCYVNEKEEIEVDEEFDERDPLCPAQDALLKVHAAIVNAVSLAGDSEKKRKDNECQILVPSSQSANIIGKSGSTIKKLRSRTRTSIKVTAKDLSDPAHSCALEFDNFVQISGDPEAVMKALFAVSSIMYKFGPKEEIPLDTSAPEPPPSIIIPSDVPIYPATGLYTGVESLVSPRSLQPILSASRSSEFQGYADSGTTWPVYSSALPVVPNHVDISQPEELIIKMLCPFNKIGRVIGKGGGSIRSVREASGARIEVDDTKGDRDGCIITITAKESLDDRKSMAVEAVLLLQEKINDEDEDKVSIRLLVPSQMIGCIIGKSGSIINEIRKRTKADVHISKNNKQKSTDASDELVEVVGERGSVRDALVQIVLRLRDDVLKDRDGSHNPPSGTDSLYSGGGLPLTSIFRGAPVTSLGYEQRVEPGGNLGLLSSSYGYGSVSMADNGYGSLSSYTPKLYGGLTVPSTLEMIIPAHAVGKVMGKGGANVENIRKISGAAVEISDSKSSRGDRVAVVSGTPEQKRAAENLIQAFIMAT